MLDQLRSRAPQVQGVTGSGTSLPFPDGIFDVVLSVAVMHHIAAPEDVHRTLGEMVRVARPGAASSFGITTRATRTGAV